MEYLNERQFRKIFQLLIKQNDEEKKKLKKYKRVNENVKMYNENAHEKVKGRRGIKNWKQKKK